MAQQTGSTMASQTIRLGYMEALLSISQLLITFDDFDQCVDEILKTLGTTADVCRTYLFQNDKKNEYTSNTHEWVREGVSRQKENLQDFPYSEIPETYDLLVAGKNIIANDIPNLPLELHEVIRAQNIKSIMLIPLLINDRFYGFMGFDSCVKTRDWTDEDFEFLQTATRLVTAAVQKRNGQQELFEAEERYKNLLQNSLDSVYLTDTKGVVIDCNEASLKLSGYTRDEVIGASFEKFLPPDQIKLASEKIGEKVKGDVIASKPYELSILTKNGTVVPLEITSMAYKRQGKIIGIIGIARDITERKRKERNSELQKNQLASSLKKLEKKVEELVDKKPQLTDKERSMLYYFARYPTYSDNVLAQIAQIKRSTITAIRNRLVKEGFLRQMTLPNLSILGQTTVAVISGSYKKEMSEQELQALLSDSIFKPGDLFFYSTDTEFIGITALPKEASMYSVLKERDILKENTEVNLFDIEPHSLLRFFDYSFLIKDLYSIVDEDRKVEPTNVVSLTRNEKRVLHAMVKYPQESILQTSQRLGLSKPTVSSLKKKLINRGCALPVVIPDVKKLSCELLVLNHWRSQRSNDSLIPQCIFHVKGTNGELSLEIFKDYYAYKSSEVSQRRSSKGIFNEPTSTKELLCQNRTIMHINFTDFLAQRLNL